VKIEYWKVSMFRGDLEMRVLSAKGRAIAWRISSIVLRNKG
jgi:hypothetical protein